jgi:protein-tyrosine kinase
VDENIIITQTDPKSPVSEAYRVLRTNIQYSGLDKPFKSIVITSAGAMEGKTTTIVNLAITFAQTGNRVLIIDADLRRPKVHTVFNLTNEQGLTNYLASQGELKTYINHNLVLPNLDVLTSGTIPPNPSEMLNSKTMKRFMDIAGSLYDIILIDSPPVGSVTDASIISTYVDGTILVVKSGKSEINAVKRAKEALEKVHANIIGVVLNDLDKKAIGNKYDYRYYYTDESVKKNFWKKLWEKIERLQETK